jgi:hypothetical protein
LLEAGAVRHGVIAPLVWHLVKGRRNGWQRCGEPVILSGVIRPLLLCAALSGCGGGDWLVSVGAFTVFDIEPRVATDNTVHFTGTAFLPRGAICTNDPTPSLVADCRCELGPLAIGHWSNSATGATGPLELTVIWRNGCVAVQTSWRTPVIAVAPGGNTIFLSLSDGLTQGDATVTVVGR